MRLRLTILLVAFATLLIAQDKRLMTAMDVAKLEYIGSAAYSDDGKYIAYTHRIQADPLTENIAAHYELYLYNTMTEESTRFLSRGSVRSLAFRPGHNSVTFLNRLNDDKTTCLYEISLNGGEARKLVGFETSISRYEWAMNGKSVLFLADEPRDKGQPKSPSVAEVYEQNLTYTRAYITTIDGSQPLMVKAEGDIVNARWSPDATKLLLSVASSPLVDDHYMTKTLQVYDIPARQVRAKVDHAGKLGEFCWSPDGSKIAFLAGADIHDPIDGRLFIADATGGKAAYAQTRLGREV